MRPVRGADGPAMLEFLQRLSGHSRVLRFFSAATDLAGQARTSVILPYLESFGNARRFARIARRVGRSKPIVAVKSGRSPAGGRATSSHTPVHSWQRRT